MKAEIYSSMIQLHNKNNIRKALREISNLSDQMHQGMYMDNAMDGSGECGGIIADGWTNWFNRQLTNVLSTNGVTLTEIEEVTNTWANRELDKGPKKIFIKWSRKHGMYKDRDFLDTKWGNIYFIINSYTNN